MNTKQVEPNWSAAFIRLSRLIHGIGVKIDSCARHEGHPITDELIDEMIEKALDESYEQLAKPMDSQ